MTVYAIDLHCISFLLQLVSGVWYSDICEESEQDRCCHTAFDIWGKCDMFFMPVWNFMSRIKFNVSA